MTLQTKANEGIMQNSCKKIEFVSNVAIIIVALLLGSVFLLRYWSPYSANLQPPEVESIKAGTKLSLSNVDWNKSSKTIVLAVSPTCRYCTTSLPFYERLVEQKNERSNFSIIVATPQSVDETQEYLNNNGFKADEVKQVST